MLDVPRELAREVAKLLRAERRSPRHSYRIPGADLLESAMASDAKIHPATAGLHWGQGDVVAQLLELVEGALLGPVHVADLWFQAAVSYSLMSPPRTGRRRILPWIGLGERFRARWAQLQRSMWPLRVVVRGVRGKRRP
jgi:hypothetical protein